MTGCREAGSIGSTTEVDTFLGAADVTIIDRTPDTRIEIDPTATCALKILIMERYHNIAVIDGLSTQFTARDVACYRCGCFIDASFDLTEAD